jgi:hypothetical protein
MKRASLESSLPADSEEELERETGIEPATSSLGSWRSTAELLPHPTQKSNLTRLTRQATQRTKRQDGYLARGSGAWLGYYGKYILDHRTGRKQLQRAFKIAYCIAH